MTGRYEMGMTIEAAMRRILIGEFLLPAVQSEFTWDHKQICVLFDSIMRGYPINTFLFWKVENKKIKEGFQFYRFLKEYCEVLNEDNPPCDIKGYDTFQAVMDGRQRLTALYLGLKGTYIREPLKNKVHGETGMQRCKLYLELDKLYAEGSNDEGLYYHFQFLTEAGYEALENKSCWFEVGKILDLKESETADDIPDITENYLEGRGIKNNATTRKTLGRLYSAMRRDDVVHYYKESSQNISHILNILVRTNSCTEIQEEIARFDRLAA